MDDLSSAAAPAIPGTGQVPGEVSSQNQPAQPQLEVEGKIDSSLPAENKVLEEKPKEDTPEKSSEEKDDPYHKNPAWQRQQRRIKSLTKRSDEQMGLMTKMTEALNGLIAFQKGEDYKPTEKAKEESPDYEELLDNELEELMVKESLSEDQEVAIMDIARKYAPEVDGEKIPLPAAVALRIYRDIEESIKKAIGASKEESAKPSTRPSSKVPMLDEFERKAADPNQYLRDNVKNKSFTMLAAEAIDHFNRMGGK